VRGSLKWFSTVPPELRKCSEAVRLSTTRPPIAPSAFTPPRRLVFECSEGTSSSALAGLHWRFSRAFGPCKLVEDTASEEAGVGSQGGWLGLRRRCARKWGEGELMKCTSRGVQSSTASIQSLSARTSWRGRSEGSPEARDWVDERREVRRLVERLVEEVATYSDAVRRAPGKPSSLVHLSTALLPLAGARLWIRSETTGSR